MGRPNRASGSVVRNGNEMIKAGSWVNVKKEEEIKGERAMRRRITMRSSEDKYIYEKNWARREKYDQGLNKDEDGWVGGRRGGEPLCEN